MRFKPGDSVHVPNLGKGVVVEVRQHGRYVVEVKQRAMVLSEEHLQPLEPRKPGRDSPVLPPSSNLPRLTHRAANVEIDLHGMIVPEALAALDAFLNDALLAGLDEVRVIHGRSGGRVKAAVHQRLSELPSIRHFRLDPANPGVTVITL